MLSNFVGSFNSSNRGKQGLGGRPDFINWTGRDGQLCVQHFHSGDDIYYRPHSHSQYTVLVCLQGGVLVTQLGQTTVIGPGEALICNCGEKHSSSYRTMGGRTCEAVSIATDSRLFTSLTADFQLPCSKKEMCLAFTGKVQSAALANCAHSIAHELKHKPSGHNIVLETQAIQLVIEAIRAWPREAVKEIAYQAALRLSRREFVRAYEYMRSCRKEDFRLQHLCRFLGSSEDRFARLFLASTGDTPARFYNRLLLDRALDLLRDAKLSIKRITFELGFKTSSHFIAVFHREFAISPQEFREQGSFSGACYTSVKTAVRNS